MAVTPKTLADLRARTRELTGDTNGTRWPTSDTFVYPLDHFINAAERHYCEATRCIRVDHQCTISAGVQEYDPAGDGFLDGIHSSRIIYSSTYEQSLTFAPPFSLGRASFLLGTPEYFFVRKILGVMKIGLMPIPSLQVVLKTVGWKVPVSPYASGYQMEQGANASQVPDPVVFDPCYLAAALCLLQIKDVEGAAAMRADYERLVTKGRRMFAARGA
jgi:hypothetical protein